MRCVLVLSSLALLVQKTQKACLSCAVAELRRDIVTEKRTQLVACSAFCVSICTFVLVKREKRAQLVV